MARSDISDTDDGKFGRRRFPDAVSALGLYHNFAFSLVHCLVG